MKHVTQLVCLLTLFNFSSQATEMYLYEDHYGNRVYADKPPASGSYEIVSTPELQTIEWQAEAIPLPAKRASTNKKANQSKHAASNHSNISDRKEDCEKLKIKIDKNQRALQTRLKADEFNRVKLALSDDRWQYRKRCS